VLDAPAVEITYGMERILMSLQGVNHFKDIRYNEKVTYGELFLQVGALPLRGVGGGGGGGGGRVG
jgi:glycyl-tRNA synthetase alpha subunit